MEIRSLEASCVKGGQCGILRRAGANIDLVTTNDEAFERVVLTDLQYFVCGPYQFRMEKLGDTC